MTARTLFLNPNSSREITATLRRHIARGGWPSGCWAAAEVEAAPRIIGSAADNARAEAALACALPGLSEGFDRVVAMSSVDTGYEIVRERFGDAAHGFTRSVLALHRKRGHRLDIVTFDRGMTALYEAAFEATGHAGTIDGWQVIDLAPAVIAAQPEIALDALRERCEGFGWRQPVFVVGVVGIGLAAGLRDAGMRQVIDPVADLLAWLGEG